MAATIRQWVDFLEMRKNRGESLEHVRRTNDIAFDLSAQLFGDDPELMKVLETKAVEFEIACLTVF